MDLKTLMRLKATGAGAKAGKNLLDVTNYDSLAGMTADCLSNGVIELESVYSDNSSLIRWKQKYPAGTYTISDKFTGEGLKNTRLLCTKQFEGGTWNNFYNAYWKNLSDNKLTFTTEEEFCIGMVLVTKTAGEPGKVYDIQLEKGSEATPYEPYKG